MKVILANDTGGTSNPGCQGTVFHLVEGLQQHGATILSRLPIGYGYELFSACHQSPLPSFCQRVGRRLRQTLGRGSAERPGARPILDRSLWAAAVKVLHSRLQPLWSEADLLVVNGEGTIHHDTVGALTLVGLCAAARQMRKKVALVNCSVVALQEWLLEQLRQSVDYIVAREPLTCRYLQSHQIPAVQGADCLFLEYGRPETAIPFALNACSVVYTPGVLSAFGKIPANMLASDIQALKSLGRNPLYWVIEAEDERFASCAVDAGATIVPLGGVRWLHAKPFLTTAEWVASGRYHVNIFAALAGTPFVPMESNTSKMEGLLELLGHPDPQSVRRFGADGSASTAIIPGAAFKATDERVRACAALANNCVALPSRPEFNL